MKSDNFLKAFAVMASVLAFASCQEKENEPDPVSPEITVTAGEATDASISFTLEAKNADEAACLVVAAAQEAPAANEIMTLGEAVSATEATVKTVGNLAAATEYAVYAVASKEGRFGDVEKLVMKTLEKGGEMDKVECAATGARVVYYGKSEVETGTFTLRLSEKGFSEDASVAPESRFYNFSIYAAVPADETAPAVPEGTFTFDGSTSGAEGTFAYGSMTAVTDATGAATGHAMVRSGSLTVTKEGDGYRIEADVVAEAGVISGEEIVSVMTSHHVTYSGAVTVKADLGEPDEPEEPTTAGPLDKDLTGIVFKDVDYALYYGQTEQGLDNLLVALSDMEVGSDGLYVGPGHYMQIDLNTMFVDNQIMDGSYAFEGSPFTLTPGYTLDNGKIDGTYVLEMDEKGNMLIGLASSGYVQIKSTDESDTYDVTVALETKDGYRMEGTYSGRISFGATGDSQSTLTGDYTADFSGETVTAYLGSYGDWYSCGHTNWTLQFETKKADGTIEGFSASLIGNGTDEAAGLPVGEYKAYSDSEGFVPMRFMPGYVDYDYLAETGWYSKADDGYTLTGAAPATDGTITVAKTGDEYTISFKLKDDAGHTFDGTWTGSLQSTGYSSAHKSRFGRTSR